MNWDTVRLIWRHEIRTLLRSRRTIILSIVLPMLVMPVMIFASRFASERRDRQLEETVYDYAITGDWSEEARLLIGRAEDALRSDPDSDLHNFNRQEVQVPDPELSLREREIQFYLNTLSSEAADEEWAAREEEDEDEVGEPPHELARRLDGVPVVQIFVPGNRASAASGARRMRRLLTLGRRAGAEGAFEDRGIPIRFSELIAIEETSMATAGETSGLLIGRFITVFLFLLTLTGGSVVAMDIIAGEKERGTLETLLTTAAGRTDIIAAKQLVIMTVALVITLIQIGNLLVYTSFDIIPLPEDFVFQVSSSSALALILLYVPLAVLVAGVLLMLSAYAKSYKEAQLYFFPVYLVGMLPAFAGAIPGVDLRSAIALIPVANVSVAAREVLAGNPDWPMTLVAFLVNSLLAFTLVRFSAGLLGEERLITASQERHPAQMTGPAAFRGQVWRWFAVLWAVMFGVAVGVPQLGTLRAQLIFNELVLFIGSTLLIIKVYGLDPRKTLAIRSVRAGLWPVILLMLPAMSLTAIPVLAFASTVFPVPRSVMEQMSEAFAAEGLPLWQLMFFVAVLPGICEEIGFRGVLLYGLRRKFRPVVLALVVGGIFGFFHVTIFRIITTGFLGIVITAVALMTGSIFPGIVLHMGNNALAIWAGEQGFPVDQLDPVVYVLAAITLLSTLWIVYRNRTPYPEE